MSKKKLVSVAVASLLALGGSLGLATGASAATAADRIAGADRYATAVEVSKTKVGATTGNNDIYIASGENYADALAGAPLAAADTDVLLLVQKNSIPAVVKTELERLVAGAGTDTITILGGTAAVSETVRLELIDILDGTVTRIDGADRYATAAKISAAISTAAGDLDGTIYLASGETFPDAIGAAAAAAAVSTGDAKVLLTKAGELPAATANEIVRLGKDDAITVVGGKAAISAAVYERADELTSGAITRVSGDNRYETSAALFPRTSSASIDARYIASGENFPDALAAATLGKPVLLVRATSIDLSVCAAALNNTTGAIKAVGGAQVIADSTIDRANVCKVNTAPTLAGTANTTVAVGATFDVLKDVTATDTQDGTITSKVTYTIKQTEAAGTAIAPVTVAAVSTAAVAKFVVTYTVVDSGGLKATADRTVTVAKAPSITGATAATGTVVAAATASGKPVTLNGNVANTLLTGVVGNNGLAATVPTLAVASVVGPTGMTGVTYAINDGALEITTAGATNHVGTHTVSVTYTVPSAAGLPAAVVSRTITVTVTAS